MKKEEIVYVVIEKYQEGDSCPFAVFSDYLNAEKCKESYEKECPHNEYEINSFYVDDPSFMKV